MEISQEFLRFLEGEFEPQAHDPEYMYELAHYEWLELFVAVEPEARVKGKVEAQVDSASELSASEKNVEHSVLILSPVVEGFLYSYPVHQISTEQPEVEEKKEKIFVSLDDSNHRPTSHQEQPKTNSGSKSVTFELDASKHKVYSPNNRQAVPKPNAEPIKRERVVRLNNPHTLKELENEPAYIRRKVQLDDVPHSSESAYSNWTLSDDEQPQLRRGNSFLHDNVD